MTDAEIIKALEKFNDRIYNTMFFFRLTGDERNAIHGVLGIINRQKAEIERLKKAYEVEATDNMLVNSENDELKAKLAMAEDYLNPLPFKNAYDEAIDKVKSEARKEFAERLKEYGYVPQLSLTCEAVVDVEDIDNLLAEMESESNA